MLTQRAGAGGHASREDKARPGEGRGRAAGEPQGMDDPGSGQRRQRNAGGIRAPLRPIPGRMRQRPHALDDLGKGAVGLGDGIPAAHEAQDARASPRGADRRGRVRPPWSQRCVGRVAPRASPVSFNLLVTSASPPATRLPHWLLMLGPREKPSRAQHGKPA